MSVGSYLRRLLLFNCLWLAPAQADELRIGVLAPFGDEAVPADWGYVRDALARELPQHHFILRPYDISGLHAAAAAAAIDFVLTSSGDYVALEFDDRASRIATLESPQASAPTAAIASTVVVLDARQDLQRLADLRGQRIAATAPQAFGGWLIVSRELLHAGLDVGHGDVQPLWLGFPMSGILAAVQQGRADAGVIRACLLEDLIARHDPLARGLRVLAPQPTEQLHCAHSTPLYPDWPFAVLPHVPHAVAKQVATALLAMPRSPEGYAWTVPTDYQSVHALYRELRSGPYAYLREWRFEDFARRYWGWLLAVFVALLGLIVHAVRVEYLVQQRTQALREAGARARSAREQLDHLGRLGLLGEMAGTLAHELNQPLAAIANFARGMIRRIDAGRLAPQPLREGAEEIAEQAERAADIIRRIRLFARKRASERQPLAVDDLLDDALHLFTGMLVELPPLTRQGLPGAVVCADRLQLQQVLVNLLKNALDALQTIPSTERMMALRARRVGDDVYIEVQDDGCGLDATGREHLFEPFFTTKSDGVGLGLSLCKTLIEAHGGHMYALPNPAGRGLVVGFTLPLMEIADAAERPSD